MNKYEIARNAKIAQYSASVNDDGAAGRVFELECAAPNSRKTAVAKQGAVDVYINYGGGHVAAECKTNGGRIESLYHAKAPRFVIYRMDWTQKHTAGKTTAAWEEKRYIEPRVIPTDLFLATLERIGAIKSTNGKNPERAIQVSSKRFYEWLLDYPITYTPGMNYTADDFEGLE